MTASDPSADVIVVGAGVAGLVTTTTLHAAGVEVICLEARERVGGRTLSTDGWVDLGATWFWDNEPTIAETVESLGLVAYRQHVAGDALFERPDGKPERLSGNPIDVPAWRLEGGMQSLAFGLARRLPEGVVQTGVPVAAVSFGADGSVQVTTADATIAGRMVVLAVPPKLALDAIAFSPELPSEVARAAAMVPTWMSDMVKAVATFEAPFWRRIGLAGAAFSHAGPFREIHDHSGPRPGQAALFGFAPAARLVGASEPAIAEQFVAQLARLWGPAAARPSAIHAVDWSRARFTAASGPARPSTSWYPADPVLHVPHLQGRLAFASTETADAFAGHLEGALRAGRRAARQAIELLDRRGSDRGRSRGRERTDQE